jgi:2-polyprenyl-3-methyl-5-hydroxy-6-metoxy-1,4-benzoquinol methylase
VSYFLPEGYVERIGAVQQLDTLEAQWQREVYEEAAKIAAGVPVDQQSIVDIGTGSGFKLMKYFNAFETIGLDLRPAVAKLREKYPMRKWVLAVPENIVECVGDAAVVICADVIEHVDDPDDFLRTMLCNARPQTQFVISTPDRDLSLCSKTGPPHNPQHVREWAFSEFRAYLESQDFHLERHFHSNVKQCTQCVVARLR